MEMIELKHGISSKQVSFSLQQYHLICFSLGNIYFYFIVIYRIAWKTQNE